MRAQAATFGAAQRTLLKDVAASVLPQSLGRRGTDAVADQFLRWLANYRAAVTTETGYGNTRIQMTPPSPAERYLIELVALDRRARERGQTFASLELTQRQALITESLGDDGPEQMPIRPGGQHVAADLMTFYFRSSDAIDRCYRAAIRRYDCRSLSGVGEPPRSLAGLA